MIKVLIYQENITILDFMYLIAVSKYIDNSTITEEDFKFLIVN